MVSVKVMLEEAAQALSLHMPNYSEFIPVKPNVLTTEGVLRIFDRYGRKSV
jgi:hypothetical protein